MDKSEFPSLSEANEISQQDKSNLESSWAEVAAQPSPEEEQKQDNASLEHAPNVWEANKENASYADVAGHEKRLTEEFPTPQESIGEEPPKVENDITPPNPDRSFADVASNKDYPKPEKDTNAPDSSLSDLPDVKDMLSKPSVRVPPPPADQSFAKIAAKEIPPEKRPLSDRAQHLIKTQNKQEEEPLSLNDDNFPTLGQSNLMAQENASTSEEKAMYTEISRFNQLEDEEDEKQNKTNATQKSFADITSSNLENAPPPAKPHVDQLPVYDEETVYLENAKREVRKNLNVEHGNNKQLTEEEELKEVQPTKEQRDQEKVNEKIYNTSREVVSGNDERHEGNTYDSRLGVFDKNNTGRITIFQTMAALYRLGYSWFSIIPGAILMHLRLSPMTSPYSFPFIYRSPFDLILLPIYTSNLTHALTYQTPMLHQNKEQVDTMVKKYGHQQGLGYWDGIRALRNMEKDTLRWYQLGLWAIHRIQWTLTFTMLHDPKSKVVTVPTLVSLSSEK